MSAITGSEKFLNAARQKIASKVLRSNDGTELGAFELARAAAAA